jgi:hypothetical protein
MSRWLAHQAREGAGRSLWNIFFGLVLIAWGVANVVSFAAKAWPEVGGFLIALGVASVVLGGFGLVKGRSET